MIPFDQDLALHKQRSVVVCNCDLNHQTVLQPEDRLSGRSVMFVHGERGVNMGSRHLRGGQLGKMLQVFDPSVLVSWKALGELAPHQFRPDVVICHKSALEDDALLPIARRWARAGTIFCADIVDGQPKQHRRVRNLVRSYICASRTEFDWRSSRRERCYFVPHHVDLRILPLRPQRSNWSLGYLGQRRNAQHLEKIKLQVLEDTPELFETGGRLLRRFLEDHSHHYSVRRYSRDEGFKPPTKIYLASHVGAVAIVSREDPESLQAVGSDYPFLSVSSRLSDVAETIRFAEERMGMGEHERALKAMEILRRDFCPARVVQSLHVALREEMLHTDVLRQHA